MSTLVRALWLSALAWSGCGGIPEVDAVRYACTDDEQCGEGFVCESLVCVKVGGDVDTGDVIDLDATDVRNPDSQPEDTSEFGDSEVALQDTSETPDGAPLGDTSDARDSANDTNVAPPEDTLVADGLDVDIEGPDTSCTSTTESCNGSDDDCDGSTDEGFPDPDGDLRASCVDSDDDGDGVEDSDDTCPEGRVGPLNDATDLDSDGCHDGSEDLDDDGDGLSDTQDRCDPESTRDDVQTQNWISESGKPGDFDGDGCRDSDQDEDDDNDEIVDDIDDCTPGWLAGVFTGSETGWDLNVENDYDSDGCLDTTEDLDDDNDRINDSQDACDPDNDIYSEKGWDAFGLSGVRPEDYDRDGCRDTTEDIDDDNDQVEDFKDDCPCGLIFQSSFGGDFEFDGCNDAQEDLDEGRDGCLGCGTGVGSCEFVSDETGVCGVPAGWKCTSCDAGYVFDSKGRCVEQMTLIPAGDFTMGAPVGEPGAQSFEIPAHAVRLRRSFYIGKHETRRREWSKISGGGVPPYETSGCPSNECPVFNVDMYSVVSFLNAKSAAEGLEPCYELNCSDSNWADGDSTGCGEVKFYGPDCEGYRLPTEAEWEFAARAGTTTATYGGTFSGRGTCSGAGGLGQIACYCGNSTGVSVGGTKNPNSYGLYDMLGNLAEMVWANRASYPTNGVRVEDPSGPTTMTTPIVVRGGSWSGGWASVRSAARDNHDVASQNATVGFRYVRTAPLAYIPTGQFVMGSTTDPGRVVDEVAHDVSVSSFLMQRHEVTQREWRSLAGGFNPSTFSSCPDCPVETIDWFSAVAYLNALSQAQGLDECYSLTGCTTTSGWWDGAHEGCTSAVLLEDCHGYRLPTEAEWEYAARAGTTTATYAGNFVDDSCGVSRLGEIAWYCGNNGASGAPDYGTKEVGQLDANAFLLSDMLGNVLEWTGDWYGTYDLTVDFNPVGPSSGTARVARGGAFLDFPGSVRAAFRQPLMPNLKMDRIGLRAVLQRP